MEMINIHNKDNKLMVIPFPGNNQNAVINMRLLSYHARKGQVISKILLLFNYLDSILDVIL